MSPETQAKWIGGPWAIVATALAILIGIVAETINQLISLYDENPDQLRQTVSRGALVGFSIGFYLARRLKRKTKEV